MNVHSPHKRWSTLKSTVFGSSSSLPPLVSEGGELVRESVGEAVYVKPESVGEVLFQKPITVKILKTVKRNFSNKHCRIFRSTGCNIS